MAKSKGSSTSKIKLSNKATNKRMNAKRKHKLNKSNSIQKQVNIANTAKVTPTCKKEQKRNVCEVDNSNPTEITEDELEDFSDEELLDYVNKNAQNLSLLSVDLERTPRQSKKNDKGDGVYEKAPRYFSKTSEDQDSFNKVDLLPIKGDRGIIRRSREIEALPPSEEVQDGVLLPIVTEVSVEETSKVPVSVVEILADHRADVNSKKLKIAHLSQDIVENPEKVSSLKELIWLCGKGNPVSIRKLSLLSLLEVFKDIIPSYRVRELSEQESSIKVSRDVNALRDFEKSLLSNYQMYLTVLDENIKDCLKLLKRKRTNGISNVIKVSLKPLVSLATISVRCLCELLMAVPHFNFRSNIIAVLIPRMELSGELHEAGKVCFDGIKSSLLADKVGDVSLEIVKMINKVVKSKVHVKPQVLEVLLSLQINTDAIRSAEQRGNKMERLRKKKEAIMKLSRKEKKRKKVEDKLDKEMQEAEIVENRDRFERLQTEVLKFLFVIYFRVLKAEHISSLLPAVLRGLAKFSHLISVDFFDDLMAALEKLLKTEELGMNESLNCIKTAIRILSGQGEVLTIDPRQFYTELYARLLLIAADGVDGEIEMAKNCVDDMILKRRKQVSLPQVMGFFKRLSTILLQLKSEEVIEYALVLRNILQLHKKCDYLLDNDTCCRGTFQPEVEDPEYSNAESTTLWELLLLQRHYNPHLETVSKHLIVGAPSQGAGSLPSKLLKRNPATHQVSEDIDEYFPDFVPEKPTSKCACANVNARWNNKTLESSVNEHKQFFEIDIEKLFPTAKRKKCNTT